MRYRLIGSILVCLFSASIFAARFSAGGAILRVNESAMKFSLKKEGAVVSLAVENPSASALTARIKLGLIDPRDSVRATAMIEASAPSGYSISTIPMVKSARAITTSGGCSGTDSVTKSPRLILRAKRLNQSPVSSRCQRSRRTFSGCWFRRRTK